jgi:CVNH domain
MVSISPHLQRDTCALYTDNYTGYLAWGMQNFSHTAHDITLTEDGRKLECYVRKADGGEREKQGIMLDKIQNIDGRLVFRKYNTNAAMMKSS